MICMRPFRIAALMTCFNRREQTLRCLEQVFAQVQDAQVQDAQVQDAQVQEQPFELTVILVDDGSTDGTAAAVEDTFPAVNVVRGSGNLFWNQGMRLAFAHASRRQFDGYLWLNDDTLLFPHAVSRLLKTMHQLESRGETAIVTGSTSDPRSGDRSYGGFRWRGGWGRQLVSVEPSPSQAVACDTMNGNCTLIPRRIAESVGNLDPAFQHSFGDMDYGFRARALGFAVYVAPGYVGSCSDNSRGGTWRDRKASFRKRWRHLNSPKGSPFPEWSLYCQRHLGVLWPLYTVSPYLKTLASAVRWPA